MMLPFFALREHRLDASLRHQEHARQVDVQRGIPLLERIVLKAAGSDPPRSRIGVELRDRARRC